MDQSLKGAGLLRHQITSSVTVGVIINKVHNVFLQNLPCRHISSSALLRLCSLQYDIIRKGLFEFTKYENYSNTLGALIRSAYFSSLTSDVFLIYGRIFSLLFFSSSFFPFLHFLSNQLNFNNESLFCSFISLPLKILFRMQNQTSSNKFDVLCLSKDITDFSLNHQVMFRYLKKYTFFLLLKKACIKTRSIFKTSTLHLFVQSLSRRTGEARRFFLCFLYEGICIYFDHTVSIQLVLRFIYYR